MKNILSFALCLFLSTQLYSQIVTPESVTPEEYATLQTNEFADHFNLSQEKRNKLYEINYTCWSKIKDTYETDMSESIKYENKVYNIKLRQQLVYSVLNSDQLTQAAEFINNSIYNQLEQF